MFRTFLFFEFEISSSTVFISSSISPSAASRASRKSLYLKEGGESIGTGVRGMWIESRVKNGEKIVQNGPKKEKEGNCSVVRNLAGEEEGCSISKDDRENSHECEGTNGAREHDVGAALHGEKRGDEERFVADFADDDGAETLQKRIRDRRVPEAAGGNRKENEWSYDIKCCHVI